MSDTIAPKEVLEQSEDAEILELPTDQVNIEEVDKKETLSNIKLQENEGEKIDNDVTTNLEGVNDVNNEDNNVINEDNYVINEDDDVKNEDDDVRNEDGAEIGDGVANQNDDEHEKIDENKNKDDEIQGVYTKVEEKSEEEKETEERTNENEEEQIIEDPPPDPAAPLNLTESTEEIKPPFELRPDQLAEVEQLWELYQDYTPVYTDLKGYVTQKELVYLLKCLLLMTYTEEQLQELISYCVKPPDPNGHIRYEQFLKMVTIRQRDFPIEEELRSALQVMDPGKTGQVEREYLKDLLKNYGNKMPDKQLNNLIKEVDMSNDGKIGIEDVVGTMGIDLNKEDLLMLMASLNPPEENISEDM